jgi:hypothetical protein
MVLGCSSAFAQLDVGDSGLNACSQIDGLSKAGNYSAAHEKAQACLQALDQKLQGQVGKLFPQTVAGWTRGSLEQNTVAGFNGHTILTTAPAPARRQRTHMPPTTGYDPIATVQQAIVALPNTNEPTFLALGSRLFTSFPSQLRIGTGLHPIVRRCTLSKWHPPASTALAVWGSPRRRNMSSVRECPCEQFFVAH